MTLSWVAMLSCTLVKQRLKLATSLPTKIEFLTDLSYFLNLSCAMGWEASDFVEWEGLTILVKAVFDGSLHQKVPGKVCLI